MSKLLTREPQADPLWMRVLERFGFATAGCVVLCMGIWTVFQLMLLPWWEQHLKSREIEMKEQSAFLRSQIDATKAQTMILRELAEDAKIERQFEDRVLRVHEEQQEALQEIAMDSKETTRQLRECSEQMKDVPRLRAEELKLLEAIKEGVNGGL